MDDHYAILGVSEDATAEEIKAAYRHQIFKHHPDRNPDDVAAATWATVAINLAYEILNNERARSRYDDFRKCSAQPRREAWGAAQQRAYEQARARYQESEEQARERVRKWFYERLGERSQKRQRCYTLQENGTALDNLLVKIDRRLGDKVWEYRVTWVPNLPNRMAYRIRIVCDPTKCCFREYHAEWVKNYYYGLFKAGTSEVAVHNERLVHKWIGDILEQDTYAYRFSVFFGVVGSIPAPWRCYLDLHVVLGITAFDAFFHAAVPGLTKFGKENTMEVANVFNHLATDLNINSADLCSNPIMRRDLARKAENILRVERGMRTLREWPDSVVCSAHRGRNEAI